MFVQLYPYKTLQKTKSFILMLGAFLVLGGGYALVRELLLSYQANQVFTYAAIVMLLAGLLSVMFATDKLPVKETYFSMTPERISFRTSLFGKEHVLRWNNICEIRIKHDVVLFELKNGTEIQLRLAMIHLPETARHISVSIRLAAMEQNILVNGVIAERQIA